VLVATHLIISELTHALPSMNSLL